MSTDSKNLNRIAEAHPSWADLEIPSRILEDGGLWLLYEFFVLHSPCGSQSCRSQSIKDKWGRAPWSTERHLKRPLSIEIFGAAKPPLYKKDSHKKLSDSLAELNLECDLRDIVGSEPRVAYVKASHPNSNMYMSLFYHIRNALAHGRFFIAENGDGSFMFLFEDGKENKKGNTFCISCRGMVDFYGLLRGIKLLENGESKSLDCEEQMLGLISGGTNKKKQIKDELGLDDSDYRCYIGVLAKEGKIKSEKSKWLLTEKGRQALNGFEKVSC